MGGHTGRWSLLAGALLVADAPVVAAPDEKPFPVDKGQILREEGVTYFVEGRKRIPKGVEISCQKDVRIVGRGGQEAVLEVEGSLQVHGVTKKEVVFEGVWVETQAKFEDVRLDLCHFTTSGGVRTVEGGSDGRLFVESCTFLGPTSVSGTFLANEVDLQGNTIHEPVVLKAVAPPGTKATRAQLMLFHGSFQGGVTVEGFSDVTVRSAVLGGAKSVFKDNAKLVLDANKVASKELEIRHSAAGRFKDTRMEKCDVLSKRVVLFAPLQKGLNEVLSVDKCWFDKETSEKLLRANLFVDAEDDSACGVRVKFGKISDKAVDLAKERNSD